MTITAPPSINLSENGKVPAVLAWLPTLLHLAHVFPGGVVPGRWSGFLLSDRHERNEIVGAARDSLLAFGQGVVSSWMSRVGTLQSIAQSSKRQYRMRIFHQLHVKVGADLLDMWFLSCRDKFHHHVEGSTTVDNVQPALRLYDRCVLGCVCFFDRRVILFMVRTFAYAPKILYNSVWSFHAMHCVVPHALDTLSNLYSDNSSRESLDFLRGIHVFV